MSHAGASTRDHGVSAPGGAGTPRPLAEERSADALATLELGAVLEVVAAHAAGPLGAARVRARRPSADRAWIAEELAAVEELAQILRREGTVAVQAAPEATEALARLAIPGSVLDGPALALVRRAIAVARHHVAELTRLADEAPRAAALRTELPPTELDRRLDRAIDPDGQVLDGASPKLGALRREIHQARERLVKRLEAMLRDLPGGDGSVTLRGGRYVIPVRRDARPRPRGIVHDESASHGTLFLEPADTIELGNDLRAAEADEAREVLRVLRELTDLLRPAAPLLAAGQAMSVRLDDLVARARYAAASDAHRPATVEPGQGLVLRQARHPLLLVSLDLVVPFDLALEPGERTLVISGPNTGGKTVLLKAVGLAAAMAQSGILPPVGPGSALPVFTRFVADIGDHQSIAANLSTFSAHVDVLRRTLESADQATLVLLDEIGSGTDPAEGGALAAASLLALTRRGATTIATTHLGSLKTLPEREPGVVNGSLHFDVATLEPTYRFAKGMPGRSYGLAIARRLGLSEGVLAEAEAEVPEAGRSLDALLAAAERRATELAAREEALTAREVEADALAARLARRDADQAAREETLTRRERDAEREARRQAKAYLLEARKRVEEALGQARAAVDEAAAREARRLLEEDVARQASALAALELTEEERPAGGAVAVGQWVRTAEGVTGELKEVRGDGKGVVTSGALRLVVDVGSLSAVKRPAARRSGARGASGGAVEGATPVLEIDLRGLTGDEAEGVALAAIDSAVLTDQPYLRIIHGKGTGVVRERVQALARGDRRVRRYAFAPANQGGSGVTVLEFTS